MRSWSAARDSELPSEIRPVARNELVAGKYRLLATLGRGGMADVYLGAAVGPAGFNKLVVIKTLRGGADDPAMVEMFLDEARLAARLSHPNVVQTYEVTESPDGYLLVMEYLEGQSLRRLARAVRSEDGAFDPALAAHLMGEALEGLHYVHQMRDYDGSPLGVVHRDVSPQNLLVTYDGQIKVLDFGIAKGALNVTDTQSGVLKGKVSYMAPEQAQNGDVDLRADIFSSGVVLWELLTGEKLFKGEATMGTLHALMTSPIQPPSAVAPDVPPELDRIVLKALARFPDGRYPTALAMSKALADFVRRSGRLVRREDVSARMQSLFGEARETMARTVQTYMTSRSHDVSSMSHITVPPSVIPTTADPIGATSGVRIATAQRRWLSMATGGALLVALAAGAFIATRPRIMASASDQATLPSDPARDRGGNASNARDDEGATFHLTLGSDPPEAQVEWGGNVVGTTPLLIDLPPGPQTFILTREGYFKGTVVMNISEGMAGRNESRTVVMVARGKPRLGVNSPALRPVNGARGAKDIPALGFAASLGPSPDVPAADPAADLAVEPAPLPATPPPATSARAEPEIAPPAVTIGSVAAPAVLPFGPEMTRPTLLTAGELVYPREAIVANVSGTIVTKCTITTDGAVKNCRIIRGLPFLDKAALDVLSTRRYTPVMLQGKAVSVEYVFNLKVVAPNR